MKDKEERKILDLKYGDKRILNRLLEKKDLEIYLRVRKEVLRKDLHNKMRSAKPEKRNKIKNQLMGRIKEIEELIHVLSDGVLRERAKDYHSEVKEDET